MTKRNLLVVLWLAIASCGQQTQSSVSNATTDSSATGTAGREEAEVPVADTAVGILKNKPYKQHVNGLPPSLTRFVPEGYSVLDTTSGDLNGDAYPDRILVLKKNGEETTSDVTEHPEKRPLFILTGGADGTYRLAARNDNAVYCIDCGGMMGDPFEGITIKNGYFSVEHYGGSAWRWTRIITFKYAPADNMWYLHKDGGSSYHASDPDKAEETVRTTKDFGKVPFDRFDIYKEEKE